jgi:HEAT repeat protein
VLLRHGKLERDAWARKNVYRALGACGGPVADKAAARVLLKAMASDKQKMVRKHAALALFGYQTADAATFVRPRLEKAALRTKDTDVRYALVYVLAHLGEAKTSVPVLEKVLDDAREDWARAYVQGAIRKLEGRRSAIGGDAFSESARWLYCEDRQDPARID